MKAVGNMWTNPATGRLVRLTNADVQVIARIQKEKFNNNNLIVL